MSHKVIAISGIWATVIGSILVTAICSGFAFAFSMNNDVISLKNQLAPIAAANLTVEVPVMREQVKQIKDTTQRIEIQQDRMSEKIEKVLQKVSDK